MAPNGLSPLAPGVLPLPAQVQTPFPAGCPPLQSPGETLHQDPGPQPGSWQGAATPRDAVGTTGR